MFTHLNSFQQEDLKELLNTNWEKIFHHQINKMKKKTLTMTMASSEQ